MASEAMFDFRFGVSMIQHVCTHVHVCVYALTVFVLHVHVHVHRNNKLYRLVASFCVLFQFDKENDRDLWQSFITGIAVVSLPENLEVKFLQCLLLITSTADLLSIYICEGRARVSCLRC